MNRLFFIKVLSTSFVVTTVAMSPYAHANLNKEVKIINRSDETITHFYASHVYDDSWGVDRLGQDVIEPDSWELVDTEDGKNGCMYDFKTVTDSGQVVFRRNVNVCEVERYTLN